MGALVTRNLIGYSIDLPRGGMGEEIATEPPAVVPEV